MADIQILMATYNSEKYLRKQLDSIIEQSNKDWKLLIRDDGSLDKTIDIVEEYRLEYPDKVRLIKNEGTEHGADTNFYELLKQASGDYVMFCDHDDVWMPDKVEVSLKKIQEMEAYYGKSMPILVYTDKYIVDKELNILPEEGYSKVHRTELNYFLVENYASGCTCILNKNLYQNIIVPGIDIFYDYWCVLVAGAIGKIGYLDKKTMKYRQHGDNVTGETRVNSLSYIFSKIKRKDLNSYQIYFLQAQELFDKYEKQLTPESCRIILAFLEMRNRRWLNRCYNTVKYRFVKSSFIRIIGQFTMLRKIYREL